MSQPHIRERFDFMPELEIDGSPKVELIVGRRLIGEGDDDEDDGDDDDSNHDETTTTTSDNNNDMDEDDTSTSNGRRGNTRGKKSTNNRRTRKRSSKADKKKKKDSNNEEAAPKHHNKYEYLIKYKGVSYLHLEWKTGSELESLNKSAKNLYRRYLKKLQTASGGGGGGDEDLEDPDFDPAFIQPQRIVDEDEHEIMVELNDEELVEWEKHQKERDGEESSSEEEEEPEEKKEEEVVKDVTSEKKENGTEGKLFAINIESLFFFASFKKMRKNSLNASFFCMQPKMPIWKTWKSASQEHYQKKKS